MKLLLLILLFIILYPIIKGWMAMNRVRRTVRDAFDAARQVDEPVEDGRKKVFGTDDGVYADFEDMAGKPSAETSDYEKTSTSGVEQQVVDADFEEIP